jgi:hypothetical protein
LHEENDGILKYGSGGQTGSFTNREKPLLKAKHTFQGQFTLPPIPIRGDNHPFLNPNPACRCGILNLHIPI